MQSNNKKTIELNTNKSTNDSVDELLDKNKEIFNALIKENLNRKEKSFISADEYQLMLSFENNITQIMDILPIETVYKLLANAQQILGKNFDTKDKEK